MKELGDSCEWIVPMGVGQYIRSLGVTRVKELEWWDETTFTLRRQGQKDRTYTITAVPLMVSHFGHHGVSRVLTASALVS